MFKINDKCFLLIRNMYENVKSCIMLNDVRSDFFECKISVRQGENLFPFLFCVFLNDLEKILVQVMKLMVLNVVVKLMQTRLLCT